MNQPQPGYPGSVTIQPYYGVQPQYYFPPAPQQLKQLKHAEINRILPQRKGDSVSGIQIKPRHIHFATQNPDERIYLVVRQHWSVNIGWMLKNFFYSLIPIIVLLALSHVNLDLEFITLKNTFIFLTLFYSFIISNLLRDFFDWYFDPYIVTDQRIVHYSFSPFSLYSIKETDLTSIEYVQEKAVGLMSNIFGYGNIIVTTASEKAQFEFKRVPNATQMRNLISDLEKIAKKYGH